jgi:hypothetical protein
MSVFDLTGGGLDRRSALCWVLRDENGVELEEHFDTERQALAAAPRRTPGWTAVPRRWLRCWTATTVCGEQFEGADGVLHWDLPNPEDLVVELLQHGWQPTVDGRWACPDLSCVACALKPVLRHWWVRSWHRPRVRVVRWRHGRPAGLRTRLLRREDGQLLCGLHLGVGRRSITIDWADSVPVIDTRGPVPGPAEPLTVGRDGYVLVLTEDGYTTADGPMPKREALDAFAQFAGFGAPHDASRLRVMTVTEYRRLRAASRDPQAFGDCHPTGAPVDVVPGEGSLR